MLKQSKTQGRRLTVRTKYLMELKCSFYLTAAAMKSTTTRGCCCTRSFTPSKIEEFLWSGQRVTTIDKETLE